VRHAAHLRRGFSLIEMMAVVVFTGIVLVAAVDFYLDLATASNAATELTRTGRRGVALLDKLARDLETAYLVKRPEETDPFEHPWVFVAESRESSAGADHLRFVRRGRAARLTDAHEADLEVVAYALVASEEREGAYDLLRWSSPRLPEGLDRTFPQPDDEGAFVLARDVDTFGVRFLDEEGAWHDTWDSSQMIESSELPIAAEISVAVLGGETVDEELDEFPLEHRADVLVKRVAIPMRPVDLSELLSADAREEEEEEDEEECVTVDECRVRNPEAFSNLDARTTQSLDSVGERCWRDQAAGLPGSITGNVQDCEDEGPEE
jgi:prepilin-type N-terminal cleavage/methylation domain-containing protein